MKNEAEKMVSEFYDTSGWEMREGVTEDARRWEDLREYAREYVSKCRLRVLRHIPESGANILDMASGPIQYVEYLEYSKAFKKRYCVDLSSKALECAKEKIGDHGVYLHGSFLDIPLEDNYFDCAISLHTIYHIDKEVQELAVRKLVSVVKPGKPVIVVYSNPLTLPERVLRVRRRVQRKISIVKSKNHAPVYYYAHPIIWWSRFIDVAIVRIYPWRSFSSRFQKLLIPNNRVGKKMFDVLFDLEERYSSFFAKNFQYPMIVLTKRKTR